MLKTSFIDSLVQCFLLNRARVVVLTSSVYFHGPLILIDFYFHFLLIENRHISFFANKDILVSVDSTKRQY